MTRELLACVMIVTGALGIVRAGSPSVPADEFFIISSIEPVKQQLLVKRPTEVTQVLRVDAQTKYFDRAQKSIGLTDLHAGDTVFITLSPANGVALEVREGAMTVAELHRRYLANAR